MKKYSLIALSIIVCLMFSSCGAAYDTAIRGEVPTENGFFYSKGEDFAEVEAAYDTAYDGALNYGSTATGSTAVISEEKLVYTSRVTLETENFEEANQTLHSAISSLGGIIVSENANNLNAVNHKGYRSLSITVRIPQENYDAFLSGLSENYNVASINNSVENMTEYYYDSESRLKSFRIQEERLFAMLEKAATVEEMLKIESRLCDVQYEIEALTNTLRTIDNDVKYATFHLNLNEVTKYTTPAPKTFGDRLGETVSDSAELFGEFAEGLLFGLIYFAPYAVIIVVAVIIIVAAIKHSKKKNAKNAAKENKDEK